MDSAKSIVKQLTCSGRDSPVPDALDHIDLRNTLLPKLISGEVRAEAGKQLTGTVS